MNFFQTIIKPLFHPAAIALSLSAALLQMSMIDTHATTLTVVHSFANGTDGAAPTTPLIQGKDGNLYGGSGGGPGDGGVFFRTTTAGAMTPLHNYFVWNDGVIDPILAKDGSIYFGLQGWSIGSGAFFNATNLDTSLYQGLGSDSFGDNITSLLQGADGSFYGTRGEYFAGTNYGTIFQIIPQSNGPAIYNEIYYFGNGGDGMDGAGPNSMIQGTDGILYGTTAGGGTNNSGTIFSISTNGVFTSLFSFGHNETPNSLMQATNGILYGTTVYGGQTGGGTIFQITTNNATFSTIFSAFNLTNGTRPNGLVQGKDGYLYGTTSESGATNSSYGTIFKITPNGSQSKFTKIFSFNGKDGSRPIANLFQAADGNFYGSTTQGGAYNYGTLFKLSNFAAAGSTYSITAPPYSYNGLFYGDTVTHQSSGFFTFALASNWRFSGKILLNGGSYTLAGILNSNTLTGTTTVSRPGLPTLTISLNLLSLSSDGQVNGTVSDGAWTANLLGDQAYYHGANPPQIGNYTAALIPQSGQNFDGVSSPGYGTTATLSVKTNGSVTVSGTTSDASALAEVASLSKNGEFPLYIPMYKGAGSMLGWITFVDSQPAYKFNGNVTWTKTNSFGLYYAGGFTNFVQLIGSQRH